MARFGAETMQFEIAIEGPLSAISALLNRLRGLLWQFETIQETTHDKGGRGKISLLETEEELLDDKLLRISRILREIERSRSLEAHFDIRVRNLSYSEPSTGDSLFARPFHPVPSIMVQPWSPSLTRAKDPRTIILDPNHAFGTGRHPTTQLCLKIMDLMANDGCLRPGPEVLDFGCGTGLLAIAAIRMGARRAVGVEVDPQSAKTAKRNVALNDLSDRIEIREGSWEIVQERYELVLANLVAAALRRTGRRIPYWVKEGGRVIVSGFGENQKDEMERFFASLGFILSQGFDLNGWGALLLLHSAEPKPVDRQPVP